MGELTERALALRAAAHNLLLRSQQLRRYSSQLHLRNRRNGAVILESALVRTLHGKLKPASPVLPVAGPKPGAANI